MLPAPEPSFGLQDARSARWTARFTFLLHSAAALLAPAACRLCTLPLLRVGRYPVCEACMQGLQPSPFAGCTRCGEALAMESARAAGLSRTDAVLCDTCTEHLPPFLRATAFGDYGGHLRLLIHLHKFNGMRALSLPLGERLAEAMARACHDSTGPLTVVAVPLFRRKRAFNQSALMADEAVRVLQRAPQTFTLHTDHALLQRTRRTESQVHLTPTQRHQNVRDAFAIQGSVTGLHVLLVDDVYTTGATVTECTRVLLRAGAATVRVVTLARTQRQLAASWDAIPTRAGTTLLPTVPAAVP